MSKFSIKNRNGFSLVEVMVAMAVIAIVTASAVTIITSALNSTKKNIYANNVEYFASDVLQAYTSAENSENFESAMKFAGYPLVKDGGTEDKYNYTFEQSKYVAEIKASYSDTDRSELSLIVKDDKGNEIKSYTFTKGDVG